MQGCLSLFWTAMGFWLDNPFNKEFHVCPERTIIHLNVADFAVAVERVVDRRLHDRPVVIAPQAGARAMVYDMSQEAYLAGVRKGMALPRARRLCSDAWVLAPHIYRYERAMQDLVRQALPYSPLIETGCADGHLFVDVTGTSRLFGMSVDVAWRLRRQIRSGLGLNPIWAVAPNKLLAKVASRLVKPEGEYVVKAGEEAMLLGPLPVTLVPGLEGRDLARLGEFNISRVSQVTALSLENLEIPFGRRAGFIYETMRGIDQSPVLPVGQTPPRVVVDHSFGRDTNDPVIIKAVLYRLVERAAEQLRKKGMAASRIVLTFDYSDGGRWTRQGSVRPASANDITLFEVTEEILILAFGRRVRIRHLQLVCQKLVFPPAQLALFPGERKRDAKREGLVAALDRIRHRYGRDAIQMGRTLAGGEMAPCFR
jgi:DNA polymerase IV